MAKSIDIRCPQCGRLYHADESHLGKSIRCVQCGKIILLIVGEPLASEQGRSAVPEVQSESQSRGSESGSPHHSTASTARARYNSSLGWIVRGLNRPQRFVVALAMFVFLITAVRPPFVIGRGIRYRWLWSHSGSRIELTRLLVEWILVVITGAVTVLFLGDSSDFAPVLAFRSWWINRRHPFFRRSASSGQAGTPSANHPTRTFRSVYAFGIATTVVVVAAILLLRPKPDTTHLLDIAGPTQSQLKQQPNNVANEPAVNQQPVSSPARGAVADADARTQTLDPRPTNYNSPPTGTRCEEEISTSGHGELTVKNGTSEDAVVRLSDASTDQIVRCFFVQAHTSAHLAHIPPGTDRLTFSTGLNWIESDDTFSWSPSYSEFERAFLYSEEHDSEGVHYDNISVTLHPVLFGNVKTNAISREQFLKGHRHVALQRP